MEKRQMRPQLANLQAPHTMSTTFHSLPCGHNCEIQVDPEVLVYLIHGKDGIFEPVRAQRGDYAVGPIGGRHQQGSRYGIPISKSSASRSSSTQEKTQ
jgi:hypothetical protein